MTLLATPTYPVAGQAVTVTSDASAVLVTDYAIEVTSVPPRSVLSTGLALVPTDHTVAQVSDPVRAAELGILADSFAPDVPGAYGVTVYLIREAPNRAFEIVRSIAATDSGTIQVGVEMTLPIRAGAFGGADLSITVADATIRAAALADHLNEASRVAALQTDVTDALTAMVGATVATACGVFLTRVTDLRDEVEDHLAGTSWHAVADTDNVVSRYAPRSVADGIVALNQLRDVLVDHLVALSTGTRWHTNDDTENAVVVSPATDLAGAQVLLSDLRERAYERHRIIGSGDAQPVHTNAGGDTTNTLSAPTLLDDVIVAYLDALVDTAPTAPTGEVPGQATAEAAGFRVA